MTCITILVSHGFRYASLYMGHSVYLDLASEKWTVAWLTGF